MSYYDDLPPTFPLPSSALGKADKSIIIEPVQRDCTLCHKYTNGRCDILGEITLAALKLCWDNGYWWACGPKRGDRPAYRHTLHTGQWAEILEKQ